MQDRTTGQQSSNEGLYLTLFAIAFIIGATLITWHEVRYNIQDTALETTFAIFKLMNPYLFVCAAAIYILVQGGTMLAERYLRRRYAEGREEGIAEGKVEGREEARAEFSNAWKRILDAHPNKTAAELRQMLDNGELHTDA